MADGLGIIACHIEADTRADTFTVFRTIVPRMNGEILFYVCSGRTMHVLMFNLYLSLQYHSMLSHLTRVGLHLCVQKYTTNVAIRHQPAEYYVKRSKPVTIRGIWYEPLDTR